ncbi:MAG: hypothetical protein GF308_12450 [Candidatus Heimdallarchaeota archaeon]|nr:hypothetical protein [Candidatus Heimdallarchaeota archaeon]
MFNSIYTRKSNIENKMADTSITAEELSESANDSLRESSAKLDIFPDFPPLDKRKEIIFDIILVSLFSLLSFILGMIYLSDNLAPGMDGGYYELQVSTLLSERKLYFETPFLSFFIMAFFGLISRNITFAVYFSASLFLAAAVVTNYFAARITWNRKVATLSLPFSALSPLLLQTSTDLIKNLLALVFIPLALAYFNKFHLKHQWRFFGLSLLFTGLTMASHLMSSLALSVCLAGYFVIHSIITILEEKRIDWKHYLYSAGLLAASAAIMGLLWVFNEFAIPVKSTYWDYSSNEVPDGNSSYVPSEQGFLLPLAAFFIELPPFEGILLLFGLIFGIVTLAVTDSKKERNGILLLFSMLLPILFLAISVDVDGWIHRMVLDVASFIILGCAFTSSYLCLGLEQLLFWLNKKQDSFDISKIKPKYTITILLSVIMIFPLIFSHIALGRTLRPIISPEEAQDLREMEGQLPEEDCLLYATHGLEYWTTMLSGYQCKKIARNQYSLLDIYDLLAISPPVSYYLTTKYDPQIPIVLPGTDPYNGQVFNLNTPLNDSVHSSPVVIRCFSTSSSPVNKIRFTLLDYFSKEVLIENELDRYPLPNGATDWNFTLPAFLEQRCYLLLLHAHFLDSLGHPAEEFVVSIFHTSEPMFTTVYIGEIFGVIKSNPSYVPNPPSFVDLYLGESLNEPPSPSNPDKNNSKPNERGPPHFNILTFPLRIRFPVLTDYLHYYFTIPLTTAYWSFLLFGTYKIVEIIISQIKNKQDEDNAI